ncbi:MAG TPA: ATP-binding protein [Verrucomicrobiae bacterium]
MKIFNSIKWRLQIWYGLILVVVLAGFGFTAYQLERNRQFRRIDDELQRRVEFIAKGMHRPPPQRGSNDGEHPFDQPPPERFSDNGSSEQNQKALRDFLDSPQAQALFDNNNPNQFSYAIYPRGGIENAIEPQHRAGWWTVDMDVDDGKSIRVVQANTLPDLGKLGTPQTIGDFRGIVRRLPTGEAIQVHCTIAPELKELRLTALKLAGFGGIILFLGLAGGWWFVSRALRPIENISAAAVKISAGDLSQRINVAETESELGQLAAVLNSTFARLESAFAQQKQFASDAAHELRTPVSVMLTQAQTALNRERTAPEYRETVETCQRAAQRMRKLIESLLALARLDAGQEVLKRLPFDFSKAVSDCVEQLKPIAEERGVKIISELSPLEITGDSERLAQVVTNLLTNAIQYNLPDGEVRVKLESQNGLAVLTVSDTGAGISAEDLPRVFERFYRADKSRSTGGNGLGLAIAKAIVEAHGGMIEVASEENAGTTFRVRLPMT